MMIPADKMEKIRAYALHMDWDVAFGGKSKGNRHLERTVGIALSLCHGRKVRKDMVEAGAWLHDIGLHLGNKGHCFSGARFIRGFLKDLGMDEKDIGLIAHCIEAHDGEVPARTLEAKIVLDADTLDKMGPLGFVRHAWKIANITDLEPVRIAEKVERHLPERLRRIYLPEAKEEAGILESALGDLLKDGRLTLRLASLVAEGSRRGVPTDDIVEDLLQSDFLPKRFARVLRGQLRRDTASPAPP